MNTIGKKFVSVALSLTTTSLVLGASFFVPVAMAQTSSDLQAQIAALNAQLAQLQGQLGGSVAGAVTFTFTRNLTLGSTGSDVQNLQIFLNSKGFVVSSSGAGAPGSESTYFGFKTKAALAKFQAANGVAPAVGFFGPITRAKIASMGGIVVTPPGTTPAPGTSAVVISTDNPAGSVVVASQSLADLAHFTFNGNYTITSLVFKRIGISADTDLSNVYLFDSNGVRLTDAASVSSGSTINFNNPSGIFSVNGVRTIAVKADIGSGATAGETVGVQLVSFTVSGGSPATVTLSGNLFSVSTATLAAVALSATTTVGTDPANDVVVWQGTATVSTRDVTFNRIALRNIGSINSSDIRNFRLYVDGTQVGSAVANLDTSGYVTFTGLGKNLQTGTRIIKVLADVIGGSSRTLQMSLRGAYDINVNDSQFGLNPAVTATGGFPFGPSSVTISVGTMSVVKATDSPSSQVTLNGSDVTLAKYTMTAYGEPVKVETLKLAASFGGAAYATSTLRNGRILINGSQYGSTATIGSSTPTSYTTNFTVYPGSPATVEVRADIFNNVSGAVAFVANDTIKITLKAGSSNGTPQVSLTPINVPTGDTDGNTVTISSGALTVTKTSSYGNQTTVIPQTAYKMADFSISNGNVEDVNVNTLTLTETASGTFAFADLQDMYIKYGAQQTTIKGTPASGDAYNVSFTVAKNASVPVQVYATIKSTGITTGDAVTVNLAVSATTASGQSSNVSATAGQKVTGVTSGTVTASLDASSPVAQIVDDSGSLTTVVAKLQPVNDGINLTGVTVAISDASAVSSFDLIYDGSVVRAGVPASTSVAITGLNLNIPANSTKLMSVRLSLSGVGVGMGATGGALTTTLSTFTGTSASTGSTSNPTGSAAGNAMYVYKAIPTISQNALPSTVLAAGLQVVSDFTVDPGSTGTMGWKTILFAITTSSASTTFSTAAATALYDVTAGSYVTLSGATTTGGTVTITANTEQTLASSHRYQLKVTLGGTILTGDSATFALNRPTTVFAASVAFGSVAGSSSFIWSDDSASAHSQTTTDWTGDFLVRNLPLSWTLSK